MNLATNRTVGVLLSLGLLLGLSSPILSGAAEQQVNVRYRIERFPVGGGAYHVASDGIAVWVTNAYDSTVTKLQASDGTQLGIFSTGEGGFPLGVAADGTNTWVANFVPGTVIKLRSSDGAL